MHPSLLLASVLAATDSVAFIRVNQLGYLPASPKVAVVCALQETALTRFSVIDTGGRAVFSGRATPSGAWASSSVRAWGVVTTVFWVAICALAHGAKRTAAVKRGASSERRSR